MGTLPSSLHPTVKLKNQNLERIISFKHRRSKSIMALEMSILVIGLLLITVGADSGKSGKPVKKLAQFIPDEIPTPEVIECVKPCMTLECSEECPPSEEEESRPSFDLGVDPACYFHCHPEVMDCAKPCILGESATE